MKQRLEYIDILRGFAIFLVVLGHVLEHVGLKDDFLFYFIYSFHMPLFICISGFVSAYVYHDKLYINNINKMGGGKFILKKFNAIMIPYILWSIIVIPFFFQTYHNSIDIGGIIRAAFIENTSYWFLPCLFGLLLCYVAYKIVREHFKLFKFWQELGVVALIFICVVTLYRITHYDMLRSIMSYYLPFWVGIFMGQYNQLRTIIIQNSSVFAICLIIFCLIEGIFVGRMDILTGKIVRLLTGLLALPIMFYLANKLTLPVWISKRLSQIGISTLGIYLIHFSFLGDLSILNQGNIVIHLLGCSLVSLAIIELCILIIRILSLDCVTKRWLLGAS